MRVLLVEDNLRLAASVQKGLEREGFTVDALGTMADAEAALNAATFDVVALDLGLPDGDGIDLLLQMRAKGDSTPVLILTARDGVGDRVRGLNSGGDDYLLKPFAMEEVVARMRALLRRPGGALGLTLHAGNLFFDTTAREVRVDTRTIGISRREMGVLEQLMRRAGRVVPKDVLEEKLYGFEDDVSSNSVEAHISRLRKRLNNAGASVSIHTLRGVGYLLSEGSEG
ncbi:response regulator [Varunaivibrio sulfuroxidans]|uniref:DNA-binding response OmpR family regulator n=1 Tax=Varunaivibrio sulfuroxidans TaxID=1773489 RepID=A0A4R3JBK5_9PROT|nr:response regulator transcription factor [Varunaivibrio sulfuroxidans]TCS62080.1 DNA-binding response OmpR family regulator [Varunaivibrio sulfuroxidans]WES30513.1 response regulator transcription factor [Varunaivibrio sulfuroxidans]